MIYFSWLSEARPVFWRGFDVKYPPPRSLFSFLIIFSHFYSIQRFGSGGEPITVAINTPQRRYHLLSTLIVLSFYLLLKLTTPKKREKRDVKTSRNWFYLNVVENFSIYIPRIISALIFYFCWTQNISIGKLALNVLKHFWSLIIKIQTLYHGGGCRLNVRVELLKRQFKIAINQKLRSACSLSRNFSFAFCRSAVSHSFKKKNKE